MNQRPRVTRLVMYKHGVAYLERSGPADGSFELSFRHGDMNDVLKSLAVGVVRGTAAFGGVGFETPSDSDALLAARKLLLTPGAALTGLLDAVRGRTVEVAADDGVHRGEVIGVDETDGGTAAPRRLLVLRTGEGALRLVDLAGVRGVNLVEKPSRDDLGYLVERSRAATTGEQRTVAVRFDGAADDVRVSYVVPAPVWRVSYRLVCDGAAVTLLGLAIVHNPVDEELADVALTLTTGQPVSFDIDLYHGKWVRRTVVEEEDRVASAPAPSGAPMPVRAMMAREMAYADPGTDADYSETGDRGEHFEYRLTAPVTLARGGSAMVPMVTTRLEDARRERVWRDGSGSAPDIVLVFTNSTGVVLEEGAAVVYDDGSYAGEAMLPYTARGAQLRLTFAKDLAVRCAKSTGHRTVTTKVRLGREGLIEEQRRDEQHLWRADNDGDTAVELWVELRRRTGYQLDGAVAPVGQTATHHRFRIDVPAHGHAELKVLESYRTQITAGYDRLAPDQLGDWLSRRLLDESTFRDLRGVLEHWEAARRLEAERDRMVEERDEAFAGQARIAEQLEVLRDAGPEGEVRARTVDQLVALQDRAAALDADIRRNRDRVDAENRSAATELERLIAGGVS
ncbi:hypothetical protein [Mycolicibacterium arseniciresistens]|uniref:Uncharacterized protein n=1 Tax=Mycolicibacterium arseniciresistens TaxID=3062257 RepID=A0ABT8UI00_9MYCO|nr:hypothetical protein [Mycolicibacterium arseniciresistens]MDO3635819.1 hypothetical protein [Mycolicibacterium arseniciresistens]